ncbi:DUF2207 domain-containing protein [Actinocorallia sp. B10E7]|uniref:DUF2207 domain-containing protein n=1 Tax=Actinocorallia sp. B10E7 TaxID=3153558 RepID=UPI00325CDF3E
MLGRIRLLAAPLVLLFLAAPGPAHAADTAAAAVAAETADDRVVRDEVVLTLGTDGVLHAKEIITYDFGTGGNGFERVFSTRIHHDEKRDRAFEVDDLQAAQPYTAKVVEEDDRTLVKVSGPQASGPQIITLDYDVVGSILPLPQGQELRWTAVGGWRVPVGEAAVSLETGVMIRNVNCFAGELSSVIGCSEFSTRMKRRQAVYGQENMLPDEYLTVIAGLPPETTSGRPSYIERKTLATSFAFNAVTGGALGALLLLLLGGFGLLYFLRGRDGRADSGVRVPLTAAGDGQAGFEPPDGVRPGQIGTLIDEQADVIDVTASIIDLAVRGYLLVEEEEGKSDWALRKLDRPVNDLHPYEQILYDGLFLMGERVKLSQLGGTFSVKLGQVRTALYEDVVKQGWFARRPDAVRSRWTVAGYLVTTLSAAGTIALAVLTNYALVGLAALAFGLALVFFGKHMPAKTGKGSTVLAHTLGFRDYLRRGEATEVPERQRIALFSRYLPYAVVFDVVEPWARTVEDAGVQGGDNLYWYEGPAEWDLAKFADSMRAFTFALSGALAQSRPYVGK